MTNPANQAFRDQLTRDLGHFTEEERRWIRLKWSKIRTAQQKADEANQDWQRLNRELNEYLDRHQITDVVQRAKIKGESLAFKDALVTGNWHSRNAERHIHDVNLFLRLREVGLL